MRATGICWDVGFDDILEQVGRMSDGEICETIDYPVSRWRHLSEGQKESKLLTVCSVYPETVGEIMGLPQEAEIPGALADGDVADWLSDTYGFCVSGYSLEN